MFENAEVSREQTSEFLTLDANADVIPADNEDMSEELLTAEYATSLTDTAVTDLNLNAETLEDTLVESPLEIDEELRATLEPAATVEEESPVVDVAPMVEFTPPALTTISVCSQTNGRENNEDSYFVQLLPTAPNTEPAVLLMLSDGMGGHDFGEHASRETLRKLALLLFEQFAIQPRLNGNGYTLTAEEIGKTIVQAVPIVSAHVQRIAESNGWNRSGATLVVAVIVGTTAVFVNVGDSPAYHICASNNRVAPMADDHSLAGMLLKAKLITPDMARVHEGRSQLEHFIGGSNLPNEMPVRMVELQPGDFVMLCSDGVSNSLNNHYILNLLSENNPAERAVGFIVHARQNGEKDNQTIILYQQGEKPGPPEVVVIPDAGSFMTATPIVAPIVAPIAIPEPVSEPIKNTPAVETTEEGSEI